MLGKMSTPVTQINYLTISKDTPIEDPETEVGRQWDAALDMLETHDGFRRLYWGRSPEDWSKVQLHIGEFSSDYASGKTWIPTNVFSERPSIQTSGFSERPRISPPTVDFQNPCGPLNCAVHSTCISPIIHAELPGPR